MCTPIDIPVLSKQLLLLRLSQIEMIFLLPIKMTLNYSYSTSQPEMKEWMINDTCQKEMKIDLITEIVQKKINKSKNRSIRHNKWKETKIPYLQPFSKVFSKIYYWKLFNDSKYWDTIIFTINMQKIKKSHFSN